MCPDFKSGWLLVPALWLTACAAAPVSQEVAVVDVLRIPSVELADLGPAPELQNEVWLNTPGPLRLADLRGRVVLLDMWTFGCINCQRVVPYLSEWYDRYREQGLVVIGNHYPEFDHERQLGNLQAALEQLEIEYPVAQDNDRRTWGAYRTRFWPTLYLIDKRGHLRYSHIGEGRYAETEAAIQTLLAEVHP